MTVLLFIFAAAKEGEEIAGLPVAVVASMVTAVVAAAATRFSTMQSRAAAHDQVVAQTAAVLQADNQDLRDEVKAIKREAHEARVESLRLGRRVGQLEDAMRTAGVSIPPE